MKVNAFSLVELSIVLVILGLLVGGVLTGQNLISAAELRSVGTDLSRYQTAVFTFRDKYFALPGDMRNATDFWEAALAGGACTTTTAGSGTQTCNGDGDGELELAAAVSQYAEPFTFWQHLANAGLIEGTYTGMAGPNAIDDVSFGENVPSSKLSGNAIFQVRYIGSRSGDADYYDGSYGNIFILGKDQVTGNHDGDGTVITAEAMWNTDKKMDDGNPGTGNLRSRTNTNRANCADSDDQSAAVYQLTNTTAGCTLLFISGF